ncbi:hypothetical protein V6N11_072416 [Hibiscus sabdariffa]|uniref:Uncharacterized protein n=1 Tax=Hibiscus sabdariffa TaxID=183260 RepID=A0ABR2U2Z2_9ROSI
METSKIPTKVKHPSLLRRPGFNDSFTAILLLSNYSLRVVPSRVGDDPGKEAAKTKAIVNRAAQKQGIYRDDEREWRSPRVSELIIKTRDNHIEDDSCDISKDPLIEPYLSSFNPTPTDASNSQMMAPNYGKEWNYGKAKAIMSDDMGDQISDSFQKISVSIGKKRKGLTEFNDEEMFSAAKRKELLDAVNEGIVQQGPGNWGDVT